MCCLAKQWLRNHNASPGDVKVYVDHIRELLHATTATAYSQQYAEKTRL